MLAARIVLDGVSHFGEGAGERPTGGKGGRPKIENGKPVRRSTGFQDSRSRNSAAVLASRLQKEHPAVYQAYLDGTHGSITAAAEAAGLVKPGHDPLKRMKVYWKKATKKQRKEFLKWIEENK